MGLAWSSTPVGAPVRHGHGHLIDRWYAGRGTCTRRGTGPLPLRVSRLRDHVGRRARVEGVRRWLGIVGQLVQVMDREEASFRSGCGQRHITGLQLPSSYARFFYRFR